MRPLALVVSSPKAASPEAFLTEPGSQECAQKSVIIGPGYPKLDICCKLSILFRNSRTVTSFFLRCTFEGGASATNPSRIAEAESARGPGSGGETGCVARLFFHLRRSRSTSTRDLDW